MKKILFGKDARKEIQKGIDKCVDVVKVSMGKKGKNVLIYNGTNTEIINDGVSIARHVLVEDNTEQAGIRLAQQCAEKTNSEAGDGTTTTLVLLQSTLKELLDPTVLTESRSLRREIRKVTQEIVKKLKESAKKVESINDIENIATTSSLNPVIGKKISEIFDELGEDANITITETRKDIIDYKIVDGIKFSTKNVALYSEDIEEYKDIPVVITTKEVDAEFLTKKIEVAHKEGETEIVIVARKFSKDAQALMTQFKIKGNFNIAAVAHQEIDTKDLKVYGNRMKRVIITKEDTTFIAGNGDTSDHVAKLKEELEKSESLYDRENLQKRISFLTGGIAEIIIGKPSDVEREEYVLKIEDAIHAARNAYKGGYLKGGGLALKEVGDNLGNSEAELIMKKVCNSAYEQICKNAEEEIIVDETVIDPFIVVSQALINAVSTATSILTSEAAMIAYEDDDN